MMSCTTQWAVLLQRVVKRKALGTGRREQWLKMLILCIKKWRLKIFVAGEGAKK